MAATLQSFGGGLALQGSMIDDAARGFRAHVEGACRDSSTPYHITLLTKEECRSRIHLSGTHDTIAAIPVDHLYFLGLGGLENSSVYWVVCIWSAGAAWRKTLGLPPKDFHITLTANDVHSVAKDASSLLNPEELTLAFQGYSPEKQDHVLYHLNSIRSDLTLPLTISRAIAHPDSAKDFLRLGDASVSLIPKLSMLAYNRALQLDPSSHTYVARRLRRLSCLTHYGPVMTAAERELIPCDLRAILVRDPWCVEARQIGHDLVPLEPPPTTLVADSRDRLWCGSYELPRFFSWIVPYFLAGMSTPRNEQDVDTLGEIGINRILTLTKEEPLPASWFAYKTVKNIFIPVENYKVPTFKEVDYFLDAVNEEQTIWLVHCGGGKGRAGTFLACYIAVYGFQKPVSGSPQPKPVCDAGTVIRWLRSMRPGSIETEEQERFIASWISYRWKSKAEDLPEPTGSMSVDGRLPANPELVILVGLPGSGKSWFSSALEKRLKAGVDVVSQDESGSRASCENAVSRRRPGKMVILDRCNASRDERKDWLALADVGENAIAVYFDIDSSICTQRIDRRIHHPTLRAGRSNNAMTQMKSLMSKPTKMEGLSAIITIPSFEAAREAVKLLGGTPSLIKFPRTQHLINLGAATNDDILSSFVSSTGPVVIEEKIDGANMGISLDWNGNLVVQNRSHTVNSRSHTQFRRLDAWLQAHSHDLHAILHQDASFPERHILYGEWVVATHSIAYSNLPDVFLAFDFYDRVTDTFISREALSRLLHGTSIQQVPLICSLPDGVSRKDLIPHMSRTSAFYDGPIEGVYVRFEDPGRMLTVDRGKVVRADFLSGNEHWSKGIIHLNAITGSAPSSSS
ncbi:hypothetical protein M758_8G169100 [Ceratodon purpureus]|nr:hypothetical protein M758_8G169100 [Ceratodon purpureus]